MRTAIALLISLAAVPLAASTVVVCDADHPAVAGKVEAVHPSANTPDWSGNAEAIVNPDLSAVAAVPLQHWRCTAQGAVVEMSAGQQADLAAWEASTALAAARSSAQSGYDDEILFKALALVSLQEINRLRDAICQLHPLPLQACQQLAPVTPQQLRDAIRAKIIELTPGDETTSVAAPTLPAAGSPR